MGIDVLAASLPPGSMTGAPKKRSCQLLRAIEEEKPRSIYSGVLGYMDVGGGGDFSVVIRTAYRWDDETTETGETWRIGAGGAITDMSQEMSEWDEMNTKVDAVLRSFKLVNQVSG
jgi:para-aminobenzoate synthetase